MHSLRTKNCQDTHMSPTIIHQDTNYSETIKTIIKTRTHYLKIKPTQSKFTCSMHRLNAKNELKLTLVGRSFHTLMTRSVKKFARILRLLWLLYSLYLCPRVTVHGLGVKKTGALKTRDWKTRNWKTRHQIAGVENVGPENGGTSKLWKAIAVENVQHS